MDPVIIDPRFIECVPCGKDENGVAVFMTKNNEEHRVKMQEHLLNEHQIEWTYPE